MFDWQSLLETHDSVAAQTCETPPSSPCAFIEEAPVTTLPPVPADAIRMVGIRKVAGEHLVRLALYLFKCFACVVVGLKNELVSP